MTTNSDAVPGWFKRRQDEEAEPEHEGGMSVTGGGGEVEPVVVWEAANRMEAQIVAGRLESEGIPTILQGEAVGTIYGLTTGNLARTVVLVPAPLADRAAAILESDVDWAEAGDELPDDSEIDGETPDDEVQGAALHE